MNWKVAFIDLKAQFKNLRPEILHQIKRVMKNASFILRNDVRKFEENMAAFLDIKHVIGLNSGTDALFLALKASGIGPGDEVITVAHTFVATLATIIHTGAKPTLVDVDENFNMDWRLVEKAISHKTKAILPVHLNGRLCQMDKLKSLAKKHKLLIIEDAAQALGAAFKGKRAGAFGTAGCFSLHPMKNLGCAGDGGFVATNDKKIAQSIRLLRNHGQRTKEDIAFFGYNSRLDNLQAAIINVKFGYLKKWIDKRRKTATLYNQGLKDLPLILPRPPSNEDFFDVFSSYVIRSPDQAGLFSYLRKKRIEVFIHWPKPLHRQKNLGLKKFYLPKTEQFSKEVISLPIYPEITAGQINFVIKTITEFHRRKNKSK
ncbi:MAG: DegT/DnrJ/EryC1/StrS family aminotransferase [Candidatus Omnitrophica bacterium]|nr:DegT/DnrJ/EryC1/StrS family aminotransferase [Candidatus Omnitrophota bacterium]